MTTTPAAILKELEAAQKDLALFQRLQTAEKRVEQLTRDYENARVTQEREEAAALEAAKEARFAGLSDIRVEGASLDHSGSELHANHRITWRGPKYDSASGTTLIRTHEVFGLLSLPPHVLAFLVELHPEQIPAAILALAPGDPWAAIETLYITRRRGYSVKAL